MLICHLRDEEAPIIELKWVNSDHIANFSYKGEFFGIKVC